MKFLLLLSCLIFSAEMEVDGNLKVTGTVDASGNPITNVGAPQTMTDAVNAGILQSALTDDGVYEYNYIRMKFINGRSTNPGSTFSTSYMELGQESWTSDFVSKLNQLMLDGWIVSHRFNHPVSNSLEALIVIYELRRPIEE